MSRKDKILQKLENSPKSVPYSDLYKICVECFGAPRQNGTSHAVFRTPWEGDPRVNIQAGKGGEAKPYQVKQVLEAIKKLEEEQ